MIRVRGLVTVSDVYLVVLLVHPNELSAINLIKVAKQILAHEFQKVLFESEFFNFANSLERRFRNT